MAAGAAGVAAIDAGLRGLVGGYDFPFNVPAGLLAIPIFLLWSRARLRELGWWIPAINQLGSYLFLVSALAAFINPETESVVNESIANWGPLAGALCFAVGGVLQAFERPGASSDSGDAPPELARDRYP